MLGWADDNSEAGIMRASLPPQWDLSLSCDDPGTSVQARGRVLWNVIAPDGSCRGQLLLKAYEE